MGDVVSIDKAREARLKRLYGVDIAWYDKTLASQGGGCAGCGWAPKPGQRRLAVDHSHKGDKKVRGLLCFKCNTALKWLRDKPDTAYNLFVYLRKSEQGV